MHGILYTRVLSVLLSGYRRAGAGEPAPVIISEDREAQLAARLLQLKKPDPVVAREGTPHVMCAAPLS